jgi:hypothetical protein
VIEENIVNHEISRDKIFVLKSHLTLSLIFKFVILFGWEWDEIFSKEFAAVYFQLTDLEVPIYEFIQHVC